MSTVDYSVALEQIVYNIGHQFIVSLSTVANR